MTAILTTRQIKDGAGTIFLQRVLDVSGTGAGPYLPLSGIAGPDGGGPVDIAALLADIVAAIQAETSLAAGSAVIGKVGLQIAGADIAASNPLPVRLAAPDFAASGLSAVSSSLTAAGSTGALAVKAGRDAILEVSGTGVADLQLEVQTDGTNWRPFFGPDGATQLYRFAYTGTAFATLLPALPVAGAAFRVTDLTHTSGTVAVRLSQ